MLSIYSTDVNSFNLLIPSISSELVDLRLKIIIRTTIAIIRTPIIGRVIAKAKVVLSLVEGGWSVGLSVGWSVGLSVGWSVG